MRHPSHVRPHVELLEDRTVPALIQSVNSGGAFINWSSTSTWLGGALPGALDEVLIPANSFVNLDMSTTVKDVSIHGRLRVISPGPINLSTDWMMVHDGLFRVGDAANPYTGKFTLTLEGDDLTFDIPDHDVTDNNAFLMVMGTGQLELHGAPKSKWTTLGQTATAGSSTITLATTPTGWAVGDEIVITSTVLTMDQAEVRKIMAINGATLTLDSGLSFSHYGMLQTYSNGVRTWNLDERAEVGNLTRNILIQGDAGFGSDGIGGNMMFHKGTSVHIDNIELFHMGQQNKFGRYPIHWHLAGNALGSYFRDSVVYGSSNRAVTIHGTNNLSVENNIAYDHVGHGIFLEDGVETGNQINYNLALKTRRPTVGLLPTDTGPISFQSQGPATYWITNPNNTFIGNVAAGSAGSGFWLIFPEQPLGESSNTTKFPQFAGYKPNLQPLGDFRDNKAHSNPLAFDINDGINPDNTLKPNVGWDPPTAEFLENFTAYGNGTALYTGIGNADTLFRNAMLADNRTHIAFAGFQTVQESLIVYRSSNSIPGLGTDGTAYLVYDGPGRLRNSYLVGFSNPNARLISTPFGASGRHTNHIFSGLTFDTSAAKVIILPDMTITTPDPNTGQANSDPRIFSFSILDEDGSLTGVAGSSIIGNHPMMRSNGDFAPAGWVNAFVSQKKFGHTTLFTGMTNTAKPDLSWTRSGGGEATVNFNDPYKIDPHHQMGMILNRGIIYDARYSASPSTRRITLALNDTVQGDNVIIRVAGTSATSGTLSVQGATRLTTANAVINSTVSAYYFDSVAATIMVKIVAPDNTGKTPVTLRW